MVPENGLEPLNLLIFTQALYQTELLWHAPDRELNFYFAA